jgi:hypothetical protein
MFANRNQVLELEDAAARLQRRTPSRYKRRRLGGEILRVPGPFEVSESGPRTPPCSRPRILTLSDPNTRNDLFDNVVGDRLDLLQQVLRRDREIKDRDVDPLANLDDLVASGLALGGCVD